MNRTYGLSLLLASFLIVLSSCADEEQKQNVEALSIGDTLQGNVVESDVELMNIRDATNVNDEYLSQ